MHNKLILFLIINFQIIKNNNYVHNIIKIIYDIWFLFLTNINFSKISFINAHSPSIPWILHFGCWISGWESMVMASFRIPPSSLKELWFPNSVKSRTRLTAFATTICRKPMQQALKAASSAFCGWGAICATRFDIFHTPQAFAFLGFPGRQKCFFNFILN